MDRFERHSCQRTTGGDITIYIPIWIDLKEEYADELKQAYANLHSNMDRFESGWRLAAGRLKQIYIPIWIDLKKCTSVSSLLITTDLHSNMDRFERTAIKPLAYDEANLHSNMDRFESAAPIVQL